MERLQKQVAGKVVEVFGGGTRLAGLHPLAGDASSRRYFRAVLQPPAAAVFGHRHDLDRCRHAHFL